MTNTAEMQDNKAALLAFIKELGLEYSARFIPLSQSRNAKENNRSLNWSVTIKRGKQSITTDYMQGIGHLPNYSHQFAKLQVYDDAVLKACETGKSAIIKHKNGYDAAQAGRIVPPCRILPAPELQDVLYSLISDSDALDYPTFEDWADNLGCDKDSRSGEKIYRACLEIGLKLRAMLGDENLSKLRGLFQGY